MVLGGITLVDAKLVSHVVYGARHYPLGLKICWAAPVVFLVSCVPALTSSSTRFKTVFHGLILLAAGAGSLFNFRPEFPHAGITLGVLYLWFVGFVSCLIHYFRIPSDWIDDANMDVQAKIARINEYATLWRTLAVSLAFGYATVLLSWSNFIWAIAPRITPKPDEIFLLCQFEITQTVLLSIYFLVGPVWESFKKAHVAAELLIRVKKRQFD